MAKQNINAATFYGKVGLIVGQRWKDKAIVRSYVIPENPRTPMQTRNRERFTTAVAASQRALVANKAAPCWEHARMTEFQYRMSTAKTRLDSGLTGFDIIPLMPNGYTPDLYVTDEELTRGATPAESYISSTTVASQIISRKFFICIQFYQTGEDVLMQQDFLIETVVGQPLILNGLPQTADLSREVFIYGISYDDRTHDNKTWYIGYKSL